MNSTITHTSYNTQNVFFMCFFPLFFIFINFVIINQYRKKNHTKISYEVNLPIHPIHIP